MATIAENLQTILDIKNDIKTAIEGKGVAVGDVSFTEYSSKIDEISGGGGGTLETINITENGVYVPSEGVDGYNQVNVNVQSKINLAETGLKFAYSNITEVPDCIDFSNIKNIDHMFDNCESLTAIPMIDTSNVTSAMYFLNRCKKLKTIPLLDFSKVTDLYYCFSYCSELTTIPQINTSSVVTFYNCFSNCIKLTTIPPIDTSKANDVGNMFSTCNSLQSLPLLDFSSLDYRIGYMFGYSDIYTLTDLGGFKNLKIDWNDNYGLYRLPNLTYESIMNVINNLYDFVANGESTTRTLKINSKTYALLSESDIALAVSKGWTISA